MQISWSDMTSHLFAYSKDFNLMVRGERQDEKRRVRLW